MTSLKSMLPEYLRTDRLTLERYDHSPEHYKCLLTAMNSPTAHRIMGDLGIRTPEEFDKLNTSARLSPNNFPGRNVNVDTDAYYLLRIGDENGPLIGGVSICQRSARVPPDMGWAVLEEYHGKGYASEAAGEMLRMVRETLGINQVMAWPGKDNLPSIGVAKKIGFVAGAPTTDDNGEEVVVYLLPGTQFDSSVQLTLYGS